MGQGVENRGANHISAVVRFVYHNLSVRPKIVDEDLIVAEY